MKFYLFRSGELSSKRKKAEPFARKNGRKAPQRKKYLISGFGHLRCSALENSGSKSPQTRMKPEKNGTTSILSSLHGRRQQNRYRSNREQPSKRKGRRRTRNASRLSLVNGGDRIDTAQPQEEKAKINDLFYGGYFRVSDL